MARLSAVACLLVADFHQSDNTASLPAMSSEEPAFACAEAVLQARQTARQMAKEAAEAAAKAAADSCAICGGEYGTDPEKASTQTLLSTA